MPNDHTPNWVRVLHKLLDTIAEVARHPTWAAVLMVLWWMTLTLVPMGLLVGIAMGAVDPKPLVAFFRECWGVVTTST